MDLTTILTAIEITLMIIGASTILFRAIAPITETKRDDNFLKAMETILRAVSLNKDENKLTITVGDKLKK